MRFSSGNNQARQPMNENPYRPPMANVEEASSTEAPALHGSASMLIATLIGGPFAAAYLVRSNFVRLHLASHARRHALVLAVFGAIALYLTIDAPPDLVSRSLLSVPFALLSVGLYLVFLERGKRADTARRRRSVWYGVAAGVVARLVIVGLITLSAEFVGTA
jgi:hypothetical protein